MARPALIAAIALALISSVIIVKSVKVRAASLGARAQVAEVGVDTHGYWFVRIAVTNTGSLPWRAVWVNHPYLTGASPIAVEIGSTLPYGEIPREFSFTVEGKVEQELPVAPEAIVFSLSALSATPWYLKASQLSSWRHTLEL
jgi:hypothetical protein